VRNKKIKKLEGFQWQIFKKADILYAITWQ